MHAVDDTSDDRRPSRGRSYLHPIALFDAIPRNDPSVMGHAEDMYSFLNRVDDPAFEQIRRLLNDWFARYEVDQPASASRDVAGRMRSKRPLQFEGAFWELYLHEAHVRLGFEVATHPKSEPHPDFTLSKAGQRAYLEATITGTNPGLPKLASNTGQIHDWINSAYDQNFFVSVDIVEAGDTTPKRAEVTRPLEAWLQSLATDWRTLRDAVERGMAPELPTCRMSIRGWLLEFCAYPKSEKSRGNRSFPMLGVYPGQAAFEGSSAAIVRSKVEEKAHHYGDLDAPLVIALHDLTPFAGRSVVNEALFGLGRPFWVAAGGSGNRVAAILAADDFGMSSVAQKTPELWLNPYARDKLPSRVLPWPVVKGVEGTADSSPIDPAVLFDLPPDWPGQPFRGA